jgi:hypothetical protein
MKILTFSLLVSVLVALLSKFIGGNYVHDRKLNQDPNHKPEEQFHSLIGSVDTDTVMKLTRAYHDNFVQFLNNLPLPRIWFRDNWGWIDDISFTIYGQPTYDQINFEFDEKNNAICMYWRDLTMDV